MRQKFLAGVLVAVMVIGLTGTALAADPPGQGVDPLGVQVAGEEGPKGRALGLEKQEELRQWREKAREWREKLRVLREKLLKLCEEGKALHEELAAKRETLRALVRQAVESGDKEKIARLEPLRVEARALVEATGELRQEMASLREALRTARENKDFEKAYEILSQMVRVKSLIVANLKTLSHIYDKAIAILS